MSIFDSLTFEPPADNELRRAGGALALRRKTAGRLIRQTDAGTQCNSDGLGRSPRRPAAYESRTSSSPGVPSTPASVQVISQLLPFHSPTS